LEKRSWKPLFPDLKDEEVDFIIHEIEEFRK